MEALVLVLTVDLVSGAVVLVVLFGGKQYCVVPVTISYPGATLYVDTTYSVLDDLTMVDVDRE